MKDHYDPAYAKSRGVKEFAILAEIATETLDDTGQHFLCEQITDALKKL
jgi:tRNA 2-selenouridine synthase